MGLGANRKGPQGSAMPRVPWSSFGRLSVFPAKPPIIEVLSLMIEDQEAKCFLLSLVSSRSVRAMRGWRNDQWDLLSSTLSTIYKTTRLTNCDRKQYYSASHWSDIYHTAYNCEIFLFPLLIIVATYIRIYTLLSRCRKNNFLSIQNICRYSSLAYRHLVRIIRI